MMTVPLISMLKTSSLTARQLAQITVEYDEVDGGGDKLVIKKILENRQKVVKKVGESSKSLKSFKGLKNLQRTLVWRNVYRSTGPLSMKNSSFR